MIALKHKKQPAFTLVETLLYIALVAIMVGTITSFFSATVEASVKSQTISEVNQQGVQLLQRMTQTTRNATLINTPSIGASGSSLSLNASTPTVFSLNGNSLQVQEAAGPAQSLSSNRIVVSNLTFTNLTSPATKGSVKIQFTLSQVNPGNQAQFNYSQTFYGTATLK